MSSRVRAKILYQQFNWIRGQCRICYSFSKRYQNTSLFLASCCRGMSERPRSPQSLLRLIRQCLERSRHSLGNRRTSRSSSERPCSSISASTSQSLSCKKGCSSKSLPNWQTERSPIHSSLRLPRNLSSINKLLSLIPSWMHYTLQTKFHRSRTKILQTLKCKTCSSSTQTPIC